MSEETHVVTTNAESHSFLDNQLRSYKEQIRRVLGLMDGSRRWGYSLWRAPVGVHLFAMDKHPDQFMQSAGSADAMCVEVKFVEDDGQARLYEVGRPGGDYSGPPSVQVPFQDGRYHVDLYPNEVFTADEAAEIYYHYFQTDGVPDEYVLREITLTSPGTELDPS